MLENEPGSEQDVILNLTIPEASVGPLFDWLLQVVEDKSLQELTLVAGIRALYEAFVPIIRKDDCVESYDDEWEEVCSTCNGSGMSFAGASNGCPSCCAGCYHCGSEECYLDACLSCDGDWTKCSCGSCTRERREHVAFLAGDC